MVKPRLPEHLEKALPAELVHIIYSFIPHFPRKTPPPSPPFYASTLKNDLMKIQGKPYRGKSPMYLFELEDFVLDRPGRIY
jgi:hypothetical protein